MPEERARPKSLSAEVMAFTMQAGGVRAKAMRKFRRIFRLNRAYRRTFFADGELTADARMILEDLIDASDFGRAQRELTVEALAEAAGRRRVVLHIFGRFALPESRLEEIERTLRDTEEPDE